MQILPIGDSPDTALSALEVLAARVAEAAHRSRVVAGCRAGAALPSGVLGRIAQAAAASLRVASAGVTLFERGSPVLAASYPAETGPREVPPVCTRVLESGATAVESNGTFQAATPVRYPDGTIAGVLFAVDPLPTRSWSADDRVALEALAASAAAHLAHAAEHLRLEAELRDSEERYRTLYQSIPIAVYHCDAGGRLLMGNSALASILGYESVEALARELPACEFRSESWDELARQGGPDGELRSRESWWRRRDGCRVLVRESLRLVCGDDGTPWYWKGTAEDITEVRRTADALRDAEGRFHAFIDHGPFVAFIKDGHGRVLYCNRRYRDVLGPDFESRVAASGALWPEEINAPLRAHDNEARAANRGLEFLEDVPLVSGEMRHWLTQKFPFSTQNGEQLLGGVAIDITDRVHMEEALRDSEERLTLSQEAAGIAYWDYYPATGVSIWSPQSYRLFELDPAITPTVEVFLGVLHPDDREKALHSVVRAVETVGELYDEFRVALSGGRTRWIMSRGKAYSDGAGRTARLSGISVDITAAKEAEAALRASEQRFRTAAEIASDVVVEWDVETGEVRLSGPVRERLSLPPGVQLPTTFNEILAVVHPADRARLAASLNRVVREGGSHHEEFRLVLSSGDVVFMEHRGAMIGGHQGGAAKYIGASTAITERKQAEEEIARLASLVQSSDDAIVSLSPAGEIESWNRGAETLYGHRAEDVRGRSWILLFPVERALEAGQILARVVRGESVRCNEIPMLRRDAQVLTVSLAVSAIRTAAGEMIGVSAIARDISDRKAVERRLAYQACHDLLTALPNRRLLAERLEQAIARGRRRGETTALLYIDLDGFKLVNDSYGHTTGDALLQQVAQRLDGCVRREDTLARTGGDEFMLVAAGFRRREDVATLARNLLASLSLPFPLQGRDLFVTASVGVALYPDHARDGSELQQRADVAMYDAKRGGKNCVRFYTPAMAEATRERLELGSDLCQALDRGQLQLYYQPQFQLGSGQLVGMEALLRWNHDRLGMVPPARFIPIAEEMGLIVGIGDWVMRQACLQMRQWETERHLTVRMAVNVSVPQFMHPDFIASVAAVLRDTGADPRQLEVELTESVVLGSFEEAATRMRLLREMGITIAMDDFGTGYSSLSYLQRLPIDAVKIDGAFVREIGATATALPLIRAITTLSHELGMRVVMEGIEKPEQVDALREIGCDEGQGFLLGRPQPAVWWSGDHGLLTPGK